MSDLIRKKDALDTLCKHCGITEAVEKCRKESADGWCKEYCELKNMPTVDAIPVQWLKERYKIEGYGTEEYFRKAYAVKEIIADWQAKQRKEE